MKLPPYPPGSCIYAVPGKTINSLDNMRSFAALYLRLNDKGGGHFVYNIDTMQRCSVGRVIGINKKPSPMTDNVVDTINKQAKEDLKGIEYADINLKTTIDDYQGGYDSDSDFEYNDKSDETSDNSTMKGDNDLDDNYDDETDQHDVDHDDPDQQEEDQQQHFNVQVNDNNSNNEDKGVGGN